MMGLIQEGTVSRIDTHTGRFTLTVPLPPNVELIPSEGDTLRVELHDPRSKSYEQVKMVWALVTDIADFNGMGKDEQYQQIKVNFAEDLKDRLVKELYSLSDSSMSMASQFISFLVDIIIEYDIPTKEPLQNNVEDIARYVYACAMHRKCCACGKGGDDRANRAEVHHIDRVGMGRDRTEINHLGMMFLPLCRECHQKAHGMGDAAFMQQMHLESVPITQAIIDKYKLGGKQE